MRHSIRVWLVVDPEFGAQVEELPMSEEIWIVESPRNDLALAQARVAGQAEMSNRHVTSFRRAGNAPECVCEMLGSLDGH